MRMFGSWTKLVSILFSKNSQDITVRPNQATTYTAARDIQLPPGDSSQVLSSATSTQTLTGKTIDGDDNTVQDLPVTSIKTIVGNANKAFTFNGSGVPQAATIVNANVDAAAAIDATKIAAGTVSNTEFGYLDGVTSAIQTQFSNKANSGANSDITSLSGLTTPLSAGQGGTGVNSLGSGVATFLQTPSSANLRTALTDSTGTGVAVFATNANLVTPALGTPSSGTLTNATGLPISTGVSGLAAGVATFLGSPTSANLASALTDETGTGANVFATNPVLVTPNLGTPSAATLTNATGLPVSTGISGLGTGIATFLATPSSANLAAALTDETGTGANVFATAPLLNHPEISDYELFDESAAPATPASGKVAVYAKTDKKMYRKGSDGIEAEIGSGSGSGTRNYISNPMFEDGTTTGWATYADAAGVAPVDGTGGSPNSTIAASSSAPLRQVYSLLFTKNSGASRQGEGTSYAFSIDNQDTGKPVSISFDFSMSANYTGSSGTEYMTAYIYDVTNSTLITPAAINIPQGTGSFNAFFLASTSTSYRLILHVSGTGTTAYTAKFDNFVVGPQMVLQGAAITDAQSFTPTGSWTTNTTYTGRFARKGQNALIDVYINLTGAPTATPLLVNLPTGLTIDTTALAGGTSNRNQILGICNLFDASPATLYQGAINYNTTTSVGVTVQKSDGTYGNTGTDVSSTVPITFASGDLVFIRMEVPIVEWASGNLQIANRALEEYAHNSGTWTANDSTSFAYGSNGAAITGSLAGLITKRVRWTTPIQPTDKFYLEFSDDRKSWFEAGQAFLLGNNGVVNALSSTGTGASSAGAYLQTVSGSTTDQDVYFFRYQALANDDAPVQDWQNLTYWRVRKVSSGAAIGYPIGARNIVGDTTGSAVPAGFIGEIISSSVTSNTNVGTSGQYFDLTSITLTKGIWEVSGSVKYIRNGATITSPDFEVGVTATTGNSPTGAIVPVNYIENLADISTTFTQTPMAMPTVHMRYDGTTVTMQDGSTLTPTNGVLYMKGYVSTYSAATPRYVCSITARRVG